MEQNYHGRGKSERPARCSAPDDPALQPGHPRMTAEVQRAKHALKQPEGR